MRFLSFFVAFFLTLNGAALGEERIALVVGNSQYASVAPLENAANDASLISQSLVDAGFEVTLLEDATQVSLKRAIAQFGRKLRSSGPDTVGLFYYAGHGVQSFGSNYLLPVDASLSDAADLDLVALEAASVLRQMASARNKTNIVILDACRNNPFEAIADFNDNGLAEMKAPTGTYLAYATAPGAVALDGVGQNSPFTAALATAIKMENAPIEKVFKQVRVDVLAQTGGAQIPWDTSSLTREFVFKAGKVLTSEEFAEQQLWNSVKLTNDPVQIMLFLRSYPAGTYESEARALLTESLKSELQQAIETPQAPEPAPAPDREAQMMEVARASGDIKDYEAYLQAFPEGLFAELVKIEIAAISAKIKPPEDAPQVAEPSGDVLPTDSPATPVYFDQPMTTGVPEIVGKTILEAAAGSPLFPPIEGLPEAVWKDKQCSTCHQWNRDDLCAQANTYLKQSASRALGKQHPYGGSFKLNLKTWASGGCQ